MLKWYNLWSTVDGAAIGTTGVSSEKYAHLSYTCYTVAAHSASATVDVCITSVVAAAATAIPGFIWPEVEFESAFTNSPLYPSKTELDFILCFRFQEVTAAITDHSFTHGSAEQKLASTGVIHAQTFWAGVSDDINSATIFRFAITNIAVDGSGSHAFEVVPILLRVGGKIAAADWKQNAAAGVFLDAGTDLTSTQSTAYVKTDYFEACWSGTETSAIKCEEYDSEDASTTYYYYPVMRRIVLKVAIPSAADFNHYVLLPAKNSLKGVNFGLLNADGNNYNVAVMYRLFGFLWSKST